MIQMLKIPFNTGTVAGLVMFSLFLVLYYAGIHPLLFGQLVLIPVPMLATIWAARRIKHGVLRGKITFRRAFYTGVVTSFIAISLCSILAYIFMSMIDTTVLDSYFVAMDDVVEIYKSNGKPVPWPYNDIDTLKKQMTVGSAAQGLFFNDFFFSAIASLVIALVMKNQKWKPGIEQGSEPPAMG
jgi:hypothetical protein